ncbi:MAG: signal recognition particle receptor subunit alpha, partial [Butyricicoccus sp.]|nr:signal recognition particle receptor subunit alpha [Butyricicoccus sp.]
MGFFDKIKEGLKRTTEAVTDQFNDLISHFIEIDEDTLEELEEALILSDLGATAASKATEKVADIARHKRIDTPIELRNTLKDVLVEMMSDDIALKTETNPSVILVIGVNGVGKTTSIGKLAARYVSEGHRVMLSAADTFRA